MFIKDKVFETYDLYNLNKPYPYGLEWKKNSWIIQQALARQEYLRFVEYERGLTTEEMHEKIDLTKHIEESMAIINKEKAEKAAKELVDKANREKQIEQIMKDTTEFYNEQLDIDTSFIDRDFDDLETKELFIIDATIRHYKYLFDELKKLRISNYKSFYTLFSTETRDDVKKIVFHVTEYEGTLETKIENYDPYWTKRAALQVIKKEYRALINQKLIEAQSIYEIKKNESILKRKIYKNEHNSAKKLCECGAEVSSRHTARHKLTAKHLKYLESQNVGMP